MSALGCLSAHEASHSGCCSPPYPPAAHSSDHILLKTACICTLGSWMLCTAILIWQLHRSELQHSRQLHSVKIEAVREFDLSCDACVKAACSVCRCEKDLSEHNIHGRRAQLKSGRGGNPPQHSPSPSPQI